MNKIVLIALALAITAHAACPNALGTQMSVTQENAENGASFASANLICATFNTALKSCCTVATLNGKKTDADALVTEFEDAAGVKDTAILAARKKIADLRTEFIALSAAYTDAVETKLASLNTGGNTDAGDIKTFFDDYIAEINTFFATYGTLYVGFNTYQTNRATCQTALVTTQVNGWCLACDTDYLTKGATDNAGTVTIDWTPATVTALRQACYPYFASSAQQTDILRLAHFAAPVETYTTNLAKLANTDDTDDAAAVTAIKNAIPSGSADGISEVPPSCTADACTWIQTALIPDLVLDKAAAKLGGTAPARRRRILQQSEGRMLAGTFTSSAAEAKADFSVESNPGDVTNTNDLSALRVGVFSCIVAFFVALLI